MDAKIHSKVGAVSPVILVVEDNPITLKSVCVALQAEGYRVLEAKDGKTTLAHMARATPDLILLDLLLPDIHGVDLMRQLRALPGGAEIPILAFSGFVSKMEESRVAGAGFTDFLLKPVEPSRLVKTIQTFLAPRSAVPEPSGRGRRLLLVDDDPVQLKLLRLQFEHAGFKVRFARHGGEALTEAGRDPPDVIVSDVLMPQLDGFELCLAVRQDPRLKNVPVVMVSANYLEEEDRTLGARVGASAFVQRNDGFEALQEAVLASLTQPVPQPAASVEEIKAERHKRIVYQLERQVALHAACVQRIVIQSAILHELGFIAGALAKRKDLESALDEILAYCLDGAGLSKGVLYLIEADDRLALRAQYGCHDALDAAKELFGAPELFKKTLESGETVILPSADVPPELSATVLKQANARSALLVPVRAGDKDVAVLMLLSLHRDLLEDDWVAFGRALAAQIGQSVALSRMFYRLAESEENFRQLAENIGEVFFLIDPAVTRTFYVSPAYEKVWGRPCESLYTDPRSWMEAIHPDDQAYALKKLTEGASTGELNLEYRIIRPDQSVRFIHARGFPIRDTSGKVYRTAGIAEDVTERRRAAETIERLAYRDRLTGLANRTALHERLQKILEEAGASALALLLININDFRQINDTLGHPNGDRLLVQVAERLQQTLWDSDTVARLAGDEFGVLLPKLADQRDIELVTRKIVDALKVAFIVADIPLDVQVTIGIALYPDHGRDTDTLFQHADVALHAAKSNHQRYLIYNTGLDYYDPHQLSLMAEMRIAIAEDVLQLYYQPKIRIRGQRVVSGVEALVRWPHPQRGLLLPDLFIPSVEKTGLINDLTVWVLNSALAEVKHWHDKGLMLDLAVNISARNLLDPDFTAQVIGCLDRHAFPPNQLTLEITESTIMLDPKGAKTKMEELHERGVLFSIDDFGIGYSSLAYLKQLPVDAIKIDKSFVIGISDANNAAIVRAAIELAHELGLGVTAEGVEDEGALQALAEMGCDTGQGYYFTRPLPPERFQTWLRECAWKPIN